MSLSLWLSQDHDFTGTYCTVVLLRIHLGLKNSRYQTSESKRLSEQQTKNATGMSVCYFIHWTHL